MSSLKSMTPFPPTQNACPDYWDVGSNPNNCGIPIKSPKNIGQIAINNGSVDKSSANNIGMCPSNTSNSFGCGSSSGLNLTDRNPDSNFQYVSLNNNSGAWGNLYPGLSERCAQRKWANTMGITWDGVTNYNGC